MPWFGNIHVCGGMAMLSNFMRVLMLEIVMVFMMTSRSVLL